MAYPATIYSQTNVAGTTSLATDDHAARHNAVGNDLAAIETTLGTNTGTAILKNFTAGNFAAKQNNDTFGTPTIIGGTVGTATIGTCTITGGVISGGSVSGSINLLTNGTIGTTTIGTSTIIGANIKGYYSTPISTTLAAAGIGTLDLAAANEFRVTFGTGNGTLVVSNETSGQKFIVSLTQDAVGTRTITWFNTIKWPDNGTPTLTVTASKRDTFGFVCTGAATFDGYIMGQNI